MKFILGVHPKITKMNVSLAIVTKVRNFFSLHHSILILNRTMHYTQVNTAEVEKCYKVLDLPVKSEQDVVKQAFLTLAKKYHPDSCSPDADIDKFVEVERAFRTLSRYNTGTSSQKDVDKIISEIKHKAPQHRQYLSFEGYGIGTPHQRLKQYQQHRAQRAAENVLEHRIAKTLVTENTVMEKGQGYKKKHDIETRPGVDRLVEDLIQESMSKGEFENLSGKGKPLKNENRNPYVDFTTHKLNEVLINNGFTPEWITMSKEIEQDIRDLKEEIRNDRKLLGPYPLIPEDEEKWKNICTNNKDLAKSINTKINTFNLIVPLLNKQKFHVQFEDICDNILKNGQHSYIADEIVKKLPVENVENNFVDFLSLLLKGLQELISFRRKNNNNNNY